MSIDDLLRDLAKTLADVPDSTAEKLREDFIRACRRLDENPAEQQRIDDMADLLDAEETLYAQALAAADRGDSATAAPLLRQCAEASLGEAAWLLAQLLEETGSTSEAMIWYQRAYDEGDARADEKLAALRARPCPLKNVAGSQGENHAVSRHPQRTENLRLALVRTAHIVGRGIALGQALGRSLSRSGSCHQRALRDSGLRRTHPARAPGVPGPGQVPRSLL